MTISKLLFSKNLNWVSFHLILTRLTTQKLRAGRRKVFPRNYQDIANIFKKQSFHKGKTGQDILSKLNIYTWCDGYTWQVWDFQGDVIMAASIPWIWTTQVYLNWFRFWVTLLIHTFGRYFFLSPFWNFYCRRPVLLWKRPQGCDVPRWWWWWWWWCALMIIRKATADRATVTDRVRVMGWSMDMEQLDMDLSSDANMIKN